MSRPRTEAAKRAFSYRGAAAWKGLNNNVKEVLNLKCLRSALTLSKSEGDLKQF